MKFSIITPSYNSEKYISDTIESIENQSIQDVEHIVVDGASDDDTINIVNKYQGITLISEPDNGQSDAINKGLKKASGDIVAWQNADDIYLPHCFERVADFFEENSDVKMVYGYYQRIDPQVKKLADVHPPSYKKWKFKYGRFYPVQPSVFFRKEVFEELGYLDESLHYCMDIDLYCRIVGRYKIGRIPHMLGAFRVHDESKTQNKENYAQVKEELFKVLNRYYTYSSIGKMLFEIFQARAKIGAYLKDEIL